LVTGPDYLTGRQWERVDEVFGDGRHAVVDVTWRLYQRTVPAYRERDPVRGRRLMPG
jgi:hypothetical protein